MYKVVEVFVKDNEDWAKLQKSETQFRSKEYLVKCAEILRVPVPAVDVEDDEKGLEENTVPGIQDTEADNIPAEFQGLQHSDDTTKDVHDAIQEEDAHESPKDRINNSDYERPRRRAAMKNRDNIKEMVATGILKVNKTDIPKLPTHAWDWNTFRDLVDAEDNITIVRYAVEPAAEDMSWDKTSAPSGNDSPVQTPTSLSPVQAPMEPLQYDDVDSDQYQEDHTRGTPRRSLRLVGDNTNWATYADSGKK